MLAPHHSVFTSQIPFLLPNQQRQSTEGIDINHYNTFIITGIINNNNVFRFVIYVYVAKVT